MDRNGFVRAMCLLVLGTFSLSWGVGPAWAQETKPKDLNSIRAKGRDPNTVRARQKQRVTNEQRLAAAARAAAKRPRDKQGPVRIGPTASGVIGAPPASASLPLAGTKPDYLGGVTPNWAWTPPLRKFVDTLPGLTSANANNLGQYIPVAIPDTATCPGSDYYEIELGQYTEKMHSDLPVTKLQGYRQTNTTDATVSGFHYLGPAIVVQKDRPVRIKFTNKLPTGMGGDLFIPVDTTGMGAGMGPYMAMPMAVSLVSGNTINIQTMAAHNLQVNERIMLTGFAPAEYNGMFTVVAVPDAVNFRVTLATAPTVVPPTTLGHIGESFTQNRATLHLHGGLTPWISDGTPHQWTTPANEITQYPKGVSVKNVPDMPDPGPGSITFFYSNQQSARLMFYHDHAWGITRLNVYTGEAAPYLITDPAEQDLITAGLLPAVQIPLVIQDKTFVDAGTLPITDPTWKAGTQPGFAVTGDLWYPHVYMPNQNVNDPNGINPMGRWDYGPWFWPPWPTAYVPYTDPVTGLVEPNLPDLSMTMEAFMDTPLVNGTAYPTLNVEPRTYRFRILNAANDRFWNLQLHQAPGLSIAVTNGGNNYSMTPTVTLDPPPAGGTQATATAGVLNGAITNIWITNPGSGYTAAPNVNITDATGTGATAVAGIGLDDVKMVPAVPGNWPAGWPVMDNRDGGVPDPSWRGPSIIQIGTEGGFLPAPKVWPNTPIGWDTDPKSITVGNIKEHNLFLGPAERADILIDFSAFRGKTIILYNDAPAAVPARDIRLDYYTGNTDTTAIGGHAATLPGYGPNIRTILQFKVADVTPAAAYSLAALQAAFASTATTPGVFARSQDPILVPQAGYNSAYNGTFPSGTTAYERIQSLSLTFTPLNLSTPAPGDLASTALTLNNTPKAIAEEFEDTWGRMSAFLGVEVPFTNGMNQTTIFYGYIDPPATFVNDNVTTGVPTGSDGTQIWKITHNGVDTHPLHFHLFDVQLINRVDWAGVVKPPELNELGWKETVRMNPLEDCIVALRPAAPKQPFGLPDSIRPLNPSMPLHDATGFKNVDTNGNPITVTNELTNFGWEYVFHCHILSHEEMDMMRPMVFNVGRSLPAAPVLTVLGGSTASLSWTDATLPTPVYPLAGNSWGNPAGEVGFRIERAVNGGAFTPLATALANATTFTDTTILPSSWYSYRVVAFNAAGDSMSNVATLAIAPGAPLNVTAVAGNAQATVSFSPPASNGGSPITLYTVTSSPGSVTATGSASPITVPGLIAGTTYTFTVTATNAVGTGPASSPSNAVTPSAPPGAPLNVTAVAGNAQATVSFSPPASTGGSPITLYRVTSSPGGVTATGSASPIMVPGLTNGTTYTFTVTATNAFGTGPASSPSNAVTPSAPPGAPLNVTAVAGNAQATVSFSPPASNGGSPITLYRVTSSPGGVTATGSASPITVPGLTNGTTYTFTVTAMNAAGTGPASSPSNAVTPMAVNLALGRPAVASTTYPGYPASNTTDGNPATRWSSAFSNNEWIYVDLGSVATIQRVVLNWEAAYGQSYKIQVSNDAVGWTDVYSTTTGNGAIDDITLVTPAIGRYVRMLGIQRATAYGYSLYEFQVYGIPGSTVNRALGRPAVASTTYPGYPASNTTDGNPATRWSSAFSNNEWIYVDLGSVVTIQRVVLNWEAAYGQSYKIQVSNDAVGWTDVYSTTTGNGAIDDLTLVTPATGRYVRMLGIQRATVYGYSLFEFQVY